MIIKFVIAAVCHCCTAFAADAPFDFKIGVSFGEGSQLVILSIDKRAGGAVAVRPTVKARTNGVPEWLLVRLRKGGIHGVDIGVWRPATVKAVEARDSELSSETVPEWLVMNASVRAEDVVAAMSGVALFEDGVLLRFEIDFALGEDGSTHVTARTPWTRYEAGRLLLVGWENFPE